MKQMLQRWLGPTEETTKKIFGDMSNLYPRGADPDILRAVRLLMGLTQIQLAETLGKTYDYISGAEIKGRASSPSYAFALYWLARYLEATGQSPKGTASLLLSDRLDQDKFAKLSQEAISNKKMRDDVDLQV